MRRRTARMAVARGDAGFAVRGYAIMKRGYLFIALATLFFSTMEIALKEVAGLFNPVQLNLTRFLIGGLVLIPFARRMLRKRGVRIDGLSLVKLAGLGFLGIVVSMTLYQLAVENTNASVVAVLFSCNPVFVLVFAGLILRTQILRQHVMALVLECLGILILINPLDTSISTAGITFTLLSTAVFALYAVLGTKMCAKYSGVVVTCGSFWLERGLAAQGMKTDFVHLENGMTRINVKIKAAQETELNGAGPDIPDEALHQLEEKLDSLAAKYDFITDRRGMGLMQGLVFDRPVAPLINAALENGLILINAGTNIIRFVPPLVITDADVDEMIEILNSCLKTFQEQNA